MADLALPAARSKYEVQLLDNVVKGRRDNEQLAKKFEASAREQRADISLILASQDRMLGGIDAMCMLTSQVNETLGALLTVVDSGFAEVAYQQRLTNEKLLEILEVLQAPLDTQAKELRRRAEEAYGNGWIDDASADFLESEALNRYDFTVHHALGTISFVHKGDLAEAKREFALAAQYARPKSPLDTAYALVALASVEEKAGSLPEALKASADAVGIADGTCPEAYYARGRYTLATGGGAEEATADLETAFWGNPGLALASMSDEILKSHGGSRDEALGRFRRGLADQLATRLTSLEAFAVRISRYSFEETPALFAPVAEQVHGAIVPQVRALQTRDSIVDYLEALRLVGPAEAASREATQRLGRETEARLRAAAQGLIAGDAGRVQRAESTAEGFTLIGPAIGAVVMCAWGFIEGGTPWYFVIPLGGLAGAMLGWVVGWIPAAIVRYIYVAANKGANPRVAILDRSADAVSAATQEACSD
jgi:hypothetical protein